MAKRPVPKYDFKAFGAAIKAARTGRKESRKKVSDEMYISPRYLTNIENNGQHPSLQIFFELIISLAKFSVWGCRHNLAIEVMTVLSAVTKNTSTISNLIIISQLNHFTFVSALLLPVLRLKPDVTASAPRTRYRRLARPYRIGFSYCIVISLPRFAEFPPLARGNQLR